MQIINPAFVGHKSDFNVTLLARGQWIEVEGAPETITFSMNTRLTSGWGIGGSVIRDEIGLVDNTDLNIDVSYSVPMSDTSLLTFGATGGIAFFNNDLASGITVDNEVYASTTGQYGNMAFGLLYTTNKYYVGLSLQNLFESPVFRLQEDIQTVNALERGNYFLVAGTTIELSKFSDITFLPSTLIKYTPTLPLSVDLNANFNFNNRFEAGVSYRHQNSVSAMASIIFYDKFRVGYAYENYLSSLGQNLNSHEIILRLDLDLKRNKKWIYRDCCSF
jgi:type IX secretion system PorP/SprF family membrane protein